jgi:predicted RNase H-like HicB family nuclease
MSVRSQVRGLDVIGEQDSDGWFVGSVPSLTGCHTQARTRAELRNRIAEAVELCLAVDLPTEPLGRPSNR